MTRMVRLGSVSAAVVTLLASSGHAQVVTNLQFLGEQVIGNALTVGGTTVGGLSGIDYDSAQGVYVTNSDDQASPRFYTLTADITSGGFNGVTFSGVTNLTAIPAFAAGNNDLENIRLSRDRQSVYVTSEGNANAGLGTSTYVFNRTTGVRTSDIAAPSQFTPTAVHGISQNLGFESQTFIGNDFAKFLVAAEGPLRQEVNVNGLPPGTTNTAAVFNVPQPLRLVRFDTLSGLAESQFIYVADPLAEPVPTTGSTFGVQGLVDILHVSADTFLGLERSFTVGGTAGGGSGYTIKLFEFSLTGATDVQGFDSISGQSVLPVSKRLLLNFADLRDGNNNPLVLDNVEGMTFGPTLANGQRSLLFVSDNNFAGSQKTQFLAFGVSVAPEPGALVLSLLGLSLIGTIALRRK